MSDLNAQTTIHKGIDVANDLNAANSAAATRHWQSFAVEIGEMSRQSIEHTSAAIEKLRNARGFADIMAIQSSYMREALDHLVRRTRRLSEMMAALPLEMSKGYAEAWSNSMKTAVKTGEAAGEKAIASAERAARQFHDS